MRISQSSSWNLPPTGRQARAITRLCLQLGIREELENKPSNRQEARQLQYSLVKKLKEGAHEANQTGNGMLRPM